MAIQLTATVECASCYAEYEGFWLVEDADTIEDITDPPVQDQSCPGCGKDQSETYPGWMFHTEAG